LISGSQQEDSATVTVVTGPAGAGKSAALGQWARRARAAGVPVAWLSLGAEDNDAFTLWSGVLHALECSGAWPPGSSLHRLSAPRRRADPAFIARFVATFAEIESDRVFLVLDDLHEVVEHRAVRSLEMLLRDIPSRLRLVLAGRVISPLSVARLRVAGRVREIGARELAFTPAETEAVLRRHLIHLSAGDLDRLVQRTEGWPAGVQLAMIARAEAGEPNRAIADFHGDDPRVSEYLVREVLDRLTPEMRSLLRVTSVCDELTADLARVLSGRDDAAAVLEELVQSQCLLYRIRSGEYRFHPMMRVHLRADLARRSRNQAAAAHLTAATWLEEHGRPVEAIEHAAAAANHERVLELLRSHGLQLVTNGNGARIRAVIEQIPDNDPIQLDPATVLVRTATSLDAQEPRAIERMLTGMPVLAPDPPVFAADRPVPAAERPVLTAGRGPQGAPIPALLSVHPLGMAVALQRARFGSEPSDAAFLLGRETAASGQPDLDLMINLERGTSWLWLGRPQPATSELQSVLTEANGRGRDWMALQSLALLAGAALAAGDLRTAETRADQALGLAADWHRPADDPGQAARNVLTWVAYHQGDDDRARRLLAENHTQDTDLGDQLEPRLLTALLREPAAGGTYSTVQEMREIWRVRWPGFVQPQLAATTCMVEQRLAYRAGAVIWAADLVDRARGVIGDTGDVAVLEAAVQAHRGRSRTARQILSPVLSRTAATVTPISDVDAWLWEARLAQRSGELRRAKTAFAQAVRLAAPQRLARPFHDGGPEVIDLLNQGAGTFGHFEEFARALRDRHGREPATSSALTTRELELLTELPSMRTAEEIAGSLYVSVNTVKTHIRAIYRKLGVNNRRDAVRQARQDGLI
jgi:LuxR family maltose regulon positive regulatory protein